MKPHHDFTAERAIARHAVLGAQADTQAFDPVTALARLAERIAAELPEALAVLGGDLFPEVTTGEPREGVMRDLLARGSAPSSHGLLSVPDGGPHLLVSLDTAGALQLVDIAFGGEGKLPEHLPEKLPLSAQIVIARIETQVAELVARMAGMATGDDSPAFAPLRRNADIAALRPFAADRALWQVSFEIAFGEAEAWTVRLTMAADHAALLCAEDDEDNGSSAPRAAESGDARSPEQLFGNIPLTLRATLVDMRVPLARIATLRPGDVLPVSVARQVPLAIGEAVIAHGTVGEVDDRVALQIINVFPSQEIPT